MFSGKPAAVQTKGFFFVGIYQELKAQAAIRAESKYANEPRSPRASIGNPVFLSVPYNQKDDAKKLGAKWDKLARSWYCPPGKDLAAFQKWLRNN